MPGWVWPVLFDVSWSISLLLMLVLSGRAFARAGPGARLPMQWGPRGATWTLPRGPAVLFTPAMAFGAYLLLSALAGGAVAEEWPLRAGVGVLIAVSFLAAHAFHLDKATPRR
jgi:hypothetical protein